MCGDEKKKKITHTDKPPREKKGVLGDHTLFLKRRRRAKEKKKNKVCHKELLALKEGKVGTSEDSVALKRILIWRGRGSNQELKKRNFPHKTKTSSHEGK